MKREATDCEIMTFAIKTLEKQKQTKRKTSRRKKIINFTAEINEIKLYI